MIRLRNDSVPARVALLAWMVFAILVAAVPAQRDAVNHTAPAVSAVSRNVLAIIRQDMPANYVSDGRSRSEWSRSLDRGKTPKAPGDAFIVRAAAAICVPQNQGCIALDLPSSVDPLRIRYFDAQGPPASA